MLPPNLVFSNCPHDVTKCSNVLFIPYIYIYIYVCFVSPGLALDKICKNMGFHYPEFSSIRTESMIEYGSVKTRILVYFISVGHTININCMKLQTVNRKINSNLNFDFLKQGQELVSPLHFEH